MRDLKTRVALVTGGSCGIGAAVAIALARAGAHVSVNYRERADAANAVCAEINGMGRKAIAVQADVSVVAAVRLMVVEIEAHLGSIDILVNNAGIAHPCKLEEITEAEWDEVLAVNRVGVLGDARCSWWYATKKAGTHHQPVFSRRTDGRSSGSALGGDHRADARLRFIADSRRNHRERHCPRAD